MNREYKEKLSRKIEQHYADLEIRIMEDIVRRIRQAGKITSTADWQINRLKILGNSSADIEKMIKDALDASYPDVFELYDQVIDWEYVRNKDLYEQINAHYIPFEENRQLQQITNALIQQTDIDLQNITQSLGFYLDYGNDSRVLTPLAQVYQGYLDAACMDIVSGAFDYNSVLRGVVMQLTNSGLRQIDYASGHANRVDVAARRAVMTGITQLTGHISDFNAATLGTEYFEVAWHAGARPAHQVWQGKVYSKEELVTVCGLGSVTGLEGINCYHERYPFFPGISERNWSDDWLDKKNREENAPKEFGGKKYTLYEAKQRQRQIETAMRAQREKVQLLQAGDADSDDIMIARAKYQGQLNEYVKFSRKMGLKQERSRIYIDNRGRVALSTKKQKEVEAWLENMYNKGDLMKNIRIYDMDLKIRKDIRSGKRPITILPGKQGKHIKGHNNYIQGRSYLTISADRAQDLVNKYAGTGLMRRDRKDRWTHKEIITADQYIGIVVDPVTGAEIPTKKFVIHYSKDGVHIIPGREDA